MMVWNSGPQDFSRLEKLGALTARLLRLAVLSKLSNGEAQLKAQGVSVSLTKEYVKHASAEAQKLLPTKRKDFELLKIKETERSTF